MKSKVFVLAIVCAASFSWFFGNVFGQVAANGPASVSSGKEAIPNTELQAKAATLLREIYKEKFEAATSSAAQTNLAREFLGKVPEMRRTTSLPAMYCFRKPVD